MRNQDELLRIIDEELRRSERTHQQIEEAFKKLPSSEILDMIDEELRRREDTFKIQLDRMEKERQMMERLVEKLPSSDMLNISDMDKENYQLACETWCEDSQRLRVMLRRLEGYIQKRETQQAHNLAVSSHDKLKTLLFNLENLIRVYIR